MNYKPSIVLDFDDTLVKSSEAIIKILNKKFGLNKTIADSKDWNYRSINRNLTEQDINNLFATEEFFNTVQWNENALNFLQKFKEEYNYIICSKGTKQNLELKEKFLEIELKEKFQIDYEFIGLEFISQKNSLNKGDINFSQCLFCIDDNTEAIESINTPIKFLIKNYTNTNWNQTPKNIEGVYVVNTFEEIIQVCEFDLEMKRRGEKIGN